MHLEGRKLRRTQLICVCLAAMAASSTVSNISGQNRDGTRRAPWKPNASSLRLLAHEVRFDRYAIRPPMGFTLTESRSNDASVYTWKSGQRAEGPPISLVVIVGVPPANERGPTLDKTLEKGLAGLKNSEIRYFQDWTFTPKERGVIDGREFVRARFAATLKTYNQPMRGIMYATRDGASSIALMSQDTGPNADAGLKAPEAAIMTFHRP